MNAREVIGEMLIGRRRSSLMKALEVIGGAALGSVSLLILFVGVISSFGSMGKYLKTKNM